MTYFILFALIILLMLIYYKLADKFNIIDKPNERSSHSNITIRGGGIIVPISLILWFLSYDFQHAYLVIGVFFAALISFLDDIYTLSAKSRISIHFLSVSLVLYDLGVFNLGWYWWIIGLIIFLGWINTFNFMDGINGITSFYTLSALGTFYYINQETTFTDINLLLLLAFGLLVFSFFNARKKALAFAGDVGSISIALILAYLMTKLILFTGRWEYILFFSVYGIDSIITIVQRLIRKENIFEAHRSHLYQYLANEMKHSHLSVSFVYALIQLAVNALVLYLIVNDHEYATLLSLIILILLSLSYISFKLKILKRIRVNS